MNGEQLHALLQRGESSSVEFKRSAHSDLESIRKTVCAFANALNESDTPAVVFVGVNDDGSCAQAPIDDETVRRLGEVRSDGSILPTPTMDIERHTIGGCELIAIVVYPHAAPPVRFKGRAYVRVGARTEVASIEDERRLVERRRTSVLPFDHQPVHGATLADVDIERFKSEYLPAAFDKATLAANGRSIEGQLIALRFATEEATPTIGGVLAFGKDPERWIPGAFVQYVRFDGKELADPIVDEKHLSGALPALLAALEDIVKLSITTKVEIGGRRELREPDYPHAALRQFVHNAVMHRTYESSNAPIRISWFNDRIEIQNPGGLFGQVNQSNFGTVTDYRNPLVAEAMRTLGFVQRFGVGIATAQKALRENGNPPAEFQFSPTSVLVTIGSR
ncbi:MAG: transcriptional regulator [Candidatus Eremiobacteraeota bacterium]|nr:transcriptional regulator [Candidatus Eremiobacteraeota bacterium]